jgi:hypothetical protein
MMSGINSGHHNLPTYEMSLKSDNVEFVRYCGSHFENGDRRNFSMSGINSGHHNLPTKEMSLKSDNVEFVRYCGALEEQFCIFKIFEMSAIFKMVAKTRHKIWALKIQHCPISSKFDING